MKEAAVIDGEAAAAPLHEGDDHPVVHKQFR